MPAVLPSEVPTGGRHNVAWSTPPQTFGAIAIGAKEGTMPGAFQSVKASQLLICQFGTVMTMVVLEAGPRSFVLCRLKSQRWNNLSCAEDDERRACNQAAGFAQGRQGVGMKFMRVSAFASSLAIFPHFAFAEGDPVWCAQEPVWKASTTVTWSSEIAPPEWSKNGQPDWEASKASDQPIITPSPDIRPAH